MMEKIEKQRIIREKERMIQNTVIYEIIVDIGIGIGS
jgi:hypothetical protein